MLESIWLALCLSLIHIFGFVKFYQFSYSDPSRNQKVDNSKTTGMCAVIAKFFKVFIRKGFLCLLYTSKDDVIIDSDFVAKPNEIVAVVGPSGQGKTTTVSYTHLDVYKRQEYMMGIYHSVLLNDIVKRLRVADVNMLEDITKFMLFNIGKMCIRDRSLPVQKW